MLSKLLVPALLTTGVVFVPVGTGNLSVAPSQAVPTVLGVQGNQFTLHDRPTFLLGISYYGALGARQDFIRQDLDDLQQHGFNWLRVWATWGAFDHDVSAVDARGEPRSPFLEKLQWLVAECDRRGIVVDVTLSRGKRSAGSLAGGDLPDFGAHRRATETIVTALKQHRNWYLDLANERDVRDDRYVPVDELKVLRERVRQLDPQRLVTASFGGHDLSRRDVQDSLIDAGHDFLSVHRPRQAQSPGQTKARTLEVLKMAVELHHPAPVHHQEPFRRGYGRWEPLAADFLADLRGAVGGGAAGWCFHNGSQRNAPDNHPRRSFDLREKRLIEQLDAEEQIVLAQANSVLTEAGAKLTAAGSAAADVVFPGADWDWKSPAEVGLDIAKLKALSDLAGGRGCVVRHGYLAYTWGDYKKTGDVASACKPFFAHFLFKALEDGKIPSLDEKVIRWEPRLGEINQALGNKDRDIEWRHFAYQTSCYQVEDKPGSAFCYNDWQMALFWDTLFGKVYGVNARNINEKVFRPLLAEPLQCQDGALDRGGRVSISPRDFCRFGLLYLHHGNWNGQQLLGKEYAVRAVTSPLPADLPRAGTRIAEMIPGQRSIGSDRKPDNQCDHEGSYSYCWWVNGVNRDGRRLWPGVPDDAYGAFGHGGIRAMAVIPSLDLVVSWNDTQLREWDKVGQGLKLIVDATRQP